MFPSSWPSGEGNFTALRERARRVWPASRSSPAAAAEAQAASGGAHGKPPTTIPFPSQPAIVSRFSLLCFFGCDSLPSPILHGWKLQITSIQPDIFSPEHSRTAPFADFATCPRPESLAVFPATTFVPRSPLCEQRRRWSFTSTISLVLALTAFFYFMKQLFRVQII
jgi:hypothetical protein